MCGVPCCRIQWCIDVHVDVCNSPSCVAEWLPDAHTLQSPTPWLLLCYCRVETVMARLQMRTRAFAAIFLLLCVGLVRR